MSVIDKANEYIGHPREVDEGYEVSMRRTAYAQGYQDAMDKACKVLKKHLFTAAIDQHTRDGFSYTILQCHCKFSTVEDLLMVLRSEMEE